MLKQLSYSGIFLCLACAVTNIGSQQKQGSVAISTSTVQVDQLGNLYAANMVNEVRKLDPVGKELGYYSNNSLGNIGLIDVTSPLKVLVFYPAFKTVVVLDRRLLETERFNLLDLGFGEINLISFSRDGTIWVFDDHVQRLYKVNQQGNILLTSEDLRLVFDQRMAPTQMSESAGNLYLSVPDRGILIFDLFGQYKTQILEPHIDKFQILDGESLVYQLDDEMIVYDLVHFKKTEYPLPREFSDAKILLTKQQIIGVRENEIVRKPLQILTGDE